MLKLITRTTLTIGLILAFGSVCTSFGQGSQGSIKGTVRDTNGAAVPNASVVVTNTSTGESRTVTTNGQGEFSVPNLTVGGYSVTASADGFANSTVKDLRVSVAFALGVEVTLNPAGAEAVVTVSSGDAQTAVNTTDQQLSTLIDNKKILELPLLSRDPNALILLAPGATQTDSGLGGFSVNGQRERNNNFLVDGVDNNDTDVPGIPGGLATPNIDATQEFRVITNNFNAEYGRNTGGIITIATKNGTNEFHGGAYIYYRSDAFSARDFFDQSGHADALQRKQFGASIGGPIVRQKAFFFFNYEGDRFTQGSQQTRVVPTALARTGILQTGSNFFGTLDIRPTGANNGTGIVFGTPNFPFSGAMLQILNNLYPLPNSSKDALIPGVFENYVFPFAFHNRQDSIATRVDYQVTQKHSLTTSFNFNNGNFALFADTFPGTGDGGDSPQRTYLGSLRLVSTLSPDWTNEVVFGYNRAQSAFNGAGDGSASLKIDSAIKAAFSSNGVATPAAFGTRNGQAISLVGGGITGLGVFDTQFRTTGTTTIGDSMTLIRGSHTLKFGGEYRWISSDGPSNFGRSEVINLGLSTVFGQGIVINNAGTDFIPIDSAAGLAVNNYLSLLSGIVAAQNQSQYFGATGQRRVDDNRRFRVREWDLFFQDTWRVRSNFTLNYGIRYEDKGVPYEADGLLSNLVQDASGPNPSLAGFEFITVGKNSANPNIGLYEHDRNNFAPRFGFNYSPGFEHGFISKLTGGPGKTSIRGGYGVFYDRVFGNLFSNARGNPPFQQDFAVFPPESVFVPTLDNIPRPPVLVPSRFVFGARGNSSGPLIFPVIFPRPGNNQFQSKFATPYTEAWNFGFQRELGNAFLLEADYVGSHSVNQLRVIDGNMTSVARVNAILGLNQPISTSLFTNFLRGSLQTAFFQSALNLSTGQGTYHALQTRITKTLTNSRFGLGQIQGAYTWSHGIDDSTDSLVPTTTGERSFPRDSSGFAGGFSGPERGNSGYDTRHRVVINAIYDLPIKFNGGVLKYLFNDWTLSTIAQAQSGHPYSVFFNGRDSQGTALSARARFAGGGIALSPTPADQQNPRVQTGPSRTLFLATIPLDGKQGLPRNIFVGPNFRKVDFSVLKRIPITERVKLQVRTDFFNIFNRVNLNIPISNVADLQFGQSTATVGTPRIIQFVGRIEF